MQSTVGGVANGRLAAKFPAASKYSVTHHHDPIRRTMKLGQPIGRMISPLALTPRVRIQDRFIYASVDDSLVHPRDQVTRLWEHWGPVA